MLTLKEIKRAVAKIGKRYGIKNAYLFGSYAKGEASEGSDVDLIIERGQIETLMQLSGFRLDLIDELGKEVDVITDDGVTPSFYELIRNDRVLVYGV